MNRDFLTDSFIERGIKRKYLKIIDDELNKRCSLCLEYFPFNLEFFHSDGKNGKLKSRCKPCCFETKHSSQDFGTLARGRPITKKAITNY